MSKKRYVITASTFDKRGRVISSANNSYSDSSKFMRYHAMLAQEPYKVFNHAECRAIELALKQKKVPHKLVILRYNSSGEMADAKPCKTCQLAIRLAGIKKVVYSTSNGMKEVYEYSEYN